MEYTIEARCVTYLTLDVEAKDVYEALEKGELADGGDYTEDPFGVEWEIVRVIDENDNIYDGNGYKVT